MTRRYPVGSVGPRSIRCGQPASRTWISAVAGGAGKADALRSCVLDHGRPPTRRRASPRSSTRCRRWWATGIGTCATASRTTRTWSTSAGRPRRCVASTCASCSAPSSSSRTGRSSSGRWPASRSCSTVRSARPRESCATCRPPTSRTSRRERCADPRAGHRHHRAPPHGAGAARVRGALPHPHQEPAAVGGHGRRTGPAAAVGRRRRAERGRPGGRVDARTSRARDLGWR